MSGYTEVFAWGGDHFGQLGLASKQTGKTYCVPRFCSFNVFIKQIACGEEHSAFIAQNGYVYTMGSNSEGRLGIGSRSVRQSASPCLVESLSSHPADFISCGWGHTAVISRGQVFTWGVGEYGALGLGTVDTQWFPAAVSLPSEVTPLSLSCGARHTAIVMQDSRTRRKGMMVTGAGEAGQLGTGRREKELSFVRVTFAEEVRQVSCGVFHTGLVTESSRIYMMGGNSFGQLGLGTKKSSSIPVRLVSLDSVPVAKIACGHHSAAVSEYGELYLWGTGAFGEYLTPQVASNISAHVVDVAIGGSFGAAIDSQNTLWTWGSNTNGELGLGDYDQRVIPSLVITLQGKRVRTVACGGAFCLALGADLSGAGPPSSSRAHIKKSLSHGVSPGFHESTSPIRQSRTHTPDSGRADPPRRPAYTTTADRDYSRIVRPPTGSEAVTRKYEDKSEADRLRQIEEDMIDDRRRNDGSVSEVARTVASKDAVSRRLEADHAKLLSETKDLEAALAAKDREIATLRSQNDRLTREKSSIEGKIFSDSSETSVLQRRVEELNADLDDIMVENRGKDTEITALRSAHDRIAEERDRFEALAREKDAALVASRSANDKYSYSRKEAEDGIRRKDAEIAALRADFRAIESAKDREITSERYKNEVLTGDKNKVDSENIALKGEIGRMTTEMKEMERKNGDLKREIDSREGDLARFLRDSDSVRREKGDLMAEIAQLTSISENLQHQNSDLKALLEAKSDEISSLRHDLDSASQSRSLITSDYSKSLTEMDVLKQQNQEIRARLTDKESDFSSLKLSFDAVSRERTSLLSQISRLENDISLLAANKDKLSTGLEQQLKVTSQVKMNAEETNRRMETDMRRKEEEMMAAMNKVRDGLEARIDALTRQLREEKDSSNELRTNLSGLETAKRTLSDHLQTESSVSAGLQRDNDQLRAIIKSRDEQTTKIAIELEDANKREKSLMATRDELQRELERVRGQLATASKEMQGMGETVQRRELENANMSRDNSQMQAAVEELKYEFEKLCQQHNDVLEEMTKLQNINEGLHEQLQRAQSECDRLSKEVTDLEAKNKEIFRNFEMELTNRARTFRERSLNALGTPSPMRPSQQTSPIPSEKSLQTSVTKVNPLPGMSSYSGRSKGDTSARKVDRTVSTTDFSKKIIKAAERMVSDPASTRKQQENISPRGEPITTKELHSFRNMTEEDRSDEENLPQFAGSEPQGRTGVQDIRTRLNALQSSKADLESKMMDLQRRMQEEPRVSVGSEELFEEK